MLTSLHIPDPYIPATVYLLWNNLIFKFSIESKCVQQINHHENKAVYIDNYFRPNNDHDFFYSFHTWKVLGFLVKMFYWIIFCVRMLIDMTSQGCCNQGTGGAHSSPPPPPRFGQQYKHSPSKVLGSWTTTCPSPLIFAFFSTARQVEMLCWFRIQSQSPVFKCMLCLKSVFVFGQ